MAIDAARVGVSQKDRKERTTRRADLAWAGGSAKVVRAEAAAAAG